MARVVLSNHSRLCFSYVLFYNSPLQGNRQCHQEAIGRGQRRGRVHPGHHGQTGGGAEKERVCQVLEKVQHDAQGLLQGGTVSGRTM